MSDHDRLPAELAGVQSRLTAALPKACSVDSDELMYRAGWAAALAQTARPIGIWTAGSLGAALAAAVMLAAMHLMSSEIVAVQETEVAALGESPPDDPPAARTAVAAQNRPQAAARRFDDARAPLLALREKALRNEFDDASEITDNIDFAFSESPASMHELRRELMPTSRFEPSSERGRAPWQWIQSWSEGGQAI